MCKHEVTIRVEIKMQVDAVEGRTFEDAAAYEFENMYPEICNVADEYYIHEVKPVGKKVRAARANYDVAFGEWARAVYIDRPHSTPK